MKNLKFWQKTFLLTLAIFVVSLCAIILFTLLQNQSKTMEVEREKATTNHFIIANTMGKDIAKLDEISQERIAALVKTYAQYYSQDEIYIELSKGAELLFTNLPGTSGATIPSDFIVENGKVNSVVKDIEGSQYIFVSGNLSELNGDYSLIYSHSIDSLFEMWDEMRNTLTLISIIIFAIVFALLFIVLRSLSKPLENLTRVADEFAGGDLSARAEKKNNDEIGNLADSFNNMAMVTQKHIDEITKTSEQNKRMAANLSHEIRTPLTAIRGYADYMQLTDLSDEEQKESLGYIVSESSRLQKISEAILRISVLKEDRIEEEFIEIDDVLCRAIATVASKARDKNVDIKMQARSETVVLGDDVLLESLFINLLDNALNACEDAGQIDILLKSERDSIEIIIKDNGRGIKPKDLEKMGEPFYRADSARSRDKGGAGLGVALCYQICSAHGAEMKYESELGEGTTVKIKFTTR